MISEGGGLSQFPYSLSLRRSYDSANSSEKTELGYGWRHNFMMSAGKSSDSYEAFGEHNPLAAVYTSHHYYRKLKEELSED